MRTRDLVSVTHSNLLDRILASAFGLRCSLAWLSWTLRGWISRELTLSINKSLSPPPPSPFAFSSMELEDILMKTFEVSVGFMLKRCALPAAVRTSLSSEYFLCVRPSPPAAVGDRCWHCPHRICKDRDVKRRVLFSPVSHS